MLAKRKIIFVIIIIIGVGFVFIYVWTKEKEKKEMIFKIEGFEIDYNLKDDNITMEAISEIKLGTSIYEIRDELGEPDSWIGSGILQPVYFVKENKVVVFHFKYPAACEDLKQIIVYEQDGKSKIIKGK